MINAPRWLLLLALGFAPWAFGSTRPWAIGILNGLFAALLALWAFGWLLRRQWPSIPPILLGAAAWLLLQGWWMYFNAGFDYPRDPSNALGFDMYQRLAVPPLLYGAAGSAHKSLTLDSMVRLSLLLGVMGFACDLAQRHEWRRRLVWTMALTGLSIVGLGLAQRFTGARAMFWQAEDLGDSFFASFRYHANAGAYMNLIWPLLAGMVAVAFRQPGQERRKYLLSAAGILCLAGLLVNTSRAAGVIGLFLLAVWCAWLTVQVFRGRWEGLNPTAVIITLALLLLVGAGVAAVVGVESSLHRWQKGAEIFSAANPRWIVAGVCWDMLAESGWWGFGAGTFQTVFPYFTQALGDTIAGVWLYAHQDYLQTAIEWGYLGALAWAVIGFGAILFSWRQAARIGEALPVTRRALHFALCLALLGVLLHALVDFPLQVASIQLYAAVMVGLLWGSRSWLTAQHESRRSHHEDEATVMDLMDSAASALTHRHRHRRHRDRKAA